MERRYPFVAVDAPAAETDELGAWLIELGAEGVEVRDEHTLSRGPGAGRVTLVASFSSLAEASRARDELARAAPELSVSVDELVGDGWRDRYKEYFRPFALTPSLTVAPPWQEQGVDAACVLWLDPGRAFGTGLHATTALVAAELDARRERYAGERVLDVGTGSGILALAALLFGAASARAIDNDDDVIEVAADNARRNGLQDRLEVDTTPLESLAERFATVVANIEARTLSRLATALAARVAPRGLLVLSGVLASEHDEVRDSFVKAGLAHLGSSQRGDGGDAWVALVMARED
jgi:ribosomal protein L11 methyltransferase